jgi:hypothetical protein
MTCKEVLLMSNKKGKVRMPQRTNKKSGGRLKALAEILTALTGLITAITMLIEIIKR